MGMYYCPPTEEVPIFVSGSCFFQYIGTEHFSSRNKKSVLPDDSVFPLVAYSGHTDHTPCSGSNCIWVTWGNSKLLMASFFNTNLVGD